MGKVILSISVNSPIKDSFPEKNYERIEKEGLAYNNINVISFNSKQLFIKPNDVYIHEIEVKSNKTNEKKYIKSAFSFIDKEYFIEIAVSSSTKNNFYADVLFNAVLTNFNIDGKWLYDPYHSKN